MTREAGSTRTIKLEMMTRVEGEGGVSIDIEGGKLRNVTVDIFEPPRFFEAFLVGRSLFEVPDLVARICGICPVAYQITAAQALETALGATVTPEIRALRRLLYCGEWIQSHALHIYLLQAPDFLGYDSAISLATAHPDAVNRGLRLKRLGNQLMDVIGGRSVHPVNVCVGGFYRTPDRRELMAIKDELHSAIDEALRTVELVSSFNFRELTPEMEFVSLTHAREYPIDDGRLLLSRGIAAEVKDFEQLFLECHVPHSNALHSVRSDKGTSYFVGPLARINMNADRLGRRAGKAVSQCGVKWPSPNPYHGIVARAIELVYACEEALALLENYVEPASPRVECKPRRGEGCGATEAPRGLLYHRYRVSDHGLVESARIVPPTAQNLQRMEDDLRLLVPGMIDAPDAELVDACEKLVRSYDPCISCATHMVRLNRR